MIDFHKNRILFCFCVSHLWKNHASAASRKNEPNHVHCVRTPTAEMKNFHIKRDRIKEGIINFYVRMKCAPCFSRSIHSRFELREKENQELVFIPTK